MIQMTRDEYNEYCRCVQLGDTEAARVMLKALEHRDKVDRMVSAGDGGNEMNSQLTMRDIGVVPKEWQYDEDCGTVLCRCPECGGRLIIGLYQYNNPYHYCPYCGIPLAEGQIA